VTGDAARLPPPPFVYPIVDAGLVSPARVPELVAALAAAGARLIQLRAKGLVDRVLAEAARAAVAAAHAGGALLIVNDRPDVARIAGADGVHVGQDDLDPADVRRLLPAGAIVGVSTHDPAQLAAAARTDADYVAVGPVFPTTTKERPDPVVGLGFVRAARAALDRPLVAIGGIAAGNARAVVEAGADGLAVASAVCAARDPAAAFREIRRALGEPR
jgi:thiamine-phosphate pyrophosphorylase